MPFKDKNPLDSRTVHDKFLIDRHGNSVPGLFTHKGYKHPLGVLIQSLHFLQYTKKFDFSKRLELKEMNSLFDQCNFFG